MLYTAVSRMEHRLLSGIGMEYWTNVCGKKGVCLGGSIAHLCILLEENNNYL